MKKIAIILPCLLLILLASCDRRTSKKEHLEQAVIEFNKNLKSYNVTNYYPESYTEIKTDSLIANTFEVSVKNFTAMDDGILINKSLENYKNITNYHRVIKADILVTVKDKIIYKKQLSAKSFRDFSDSKFWQNTTLEHVWVNQELSTTQNVSLSVSFVDPKSKAFRLYELRIDKNGNERLTLIEDHS